MIMLSMVLTSVGLPLEGIGLIMGVERIIDMFRTTVNVMGDNIVTLIIANSEKDLNLDESTMLAGVPNAPSVYSPSVNPDLAKKRQYHVINTMIEYGYITNEEANSIK